MSKPTDPTRRIELYDTTLRDGAQGEDVAFSLVDKIKIAEALDALGVDFIEGGYPLSNPKDEAFFEQISKGELTNARICAFGMTRRKGVRPEDDAGMKALVGSKASVITIVGKAWDLHVDEVLRVDRDENLAMIRDSIEFCVEHSQTGGDVFFDAEHFFDGYKANRDYAMKTLAAALGGGASRLILCDTNGGSMPDEIGGIVGEVRNELGRDVQLGIHTHDDSGVAVANTLVAVEAGCTHVQGTINGLGERCGNVDLITVAADLRLKLGYDCLGGRPLVGLTDMSRLVYELANMGLKPSQPFVGRAAFAHKGGMHVHAVQRVSRSYEHVSPEEVGNSRRVLISEVGGASNIVAMCAAKFDIAGDRELQRKLLDRVQDLENEGYQFESATASFELLLHRIMGTCPEYWDLDHYRCVILKRNGEPCATEAIVKVAVAGGFEHQVAEGDGPINALDSALRKCLRPHYRQLDQVHLRDYKVRVVNPTAESAAKVRVVVEFAVTGEQGEQRDYFATVGVNENIVDASWEALTDAFAHHLIESDASPV